MTNSLRSKFQGIFKIKLVGGELEIVLILEAIEKEQLRGFNHLIIIKDDR